MPDHTDGFMGKRKMKPILFNTEMVRAILDNRKTVTRRVVKPQPVCYGPNVTFKPHDDDFFLSAEKNWLRCRVCGHDPEYSREGSNTSHHWIPPYRPGDILYALERWKCSSDSLLWDNDEYRVVFPDREVVRFYFTEQKRLEKWRKYIDKPLDNWQSPYFMPREAARIFLRVTDVRVERLQDITESQAMAEGCNGKFLGTGEAIGGGWEITPQDEFVSIWNITIKPKDRAIYGWAVNPYVWVIKFERISKEEAGAHSCQGAMRCKAGGKEVKTE